MYHETEDSSRDVHGPIERWYHPFMAKKKSEFAEAAIAGVFAAGATYIYQERYSYADSPTGVHLSSIAPIGVAAVAWWMLRKKHRTIGNGLVIGTISGNIVVGSRNTAQMLVASNEARQSGQNVGQSAT